MRINNYVFIGLFFLILGSCGTKKQILKPSPDLPESADRIYDYTLNRNIPYHYLVIKNIKIDLQTSDNRSRLYGAVKMVKDSAILLSLRAPLGIELSRILYTKDSVKILDRQEKKAYFTDYRHLAEFVPLEFGFQILQSIFSGNIPENYNIKNIPEPEFIRDTLKNEVYLGTFGAPDPSDQMNFYGWIYSGRVRPSLLIFHRNDESERYKVKYREYQYIESQYFPKEVEVTFDRYNDTSTLKLQMNGISLKESVDIYLNVPSSYERIIR